MQNIPLLPKGESVTLTSEELQTPLAIGNHNLTIRIDPLGLFDDCRRANNEQSDVFKVWPDSELVATGISVSPQYPTVYDELTYRFTVMNAGYFDLATVEADEKINIERVTPLNSNWLKQNLHTVVFIQNKITKEVIQANSSE